MTSRGVRLGTLLDTKAKLAVSEDGNASKSSNTCVACQGGLVPLGKSRDYLYCSCNNCKTIQLSPVPSQHDIERAYSDSQFAVEAHGQGDPEAIYASSRPYYANIADALTDNKISGQVVDYGAGWGGLCALLRERGFQCRGVELAKEMVDGCKRRNLPVEQGTLATLLRQGLTAQAVVLCGVFEHLSQPREFLRDAHQLLDEGGVLVSLQPTAAFAALLAWMCRLGQRQRPLPPWFWVFDAPWHIALYSPEGMKLMAEQEGFDLVEIRFCPLGRVKGLYGLVQRIVEAINKLGWGISGSQWPLSVSHTFVFRKR
jgi:SAM-dependent methyltransferase